MEVAHQLTARNAEITLEWVPRDQNQDADDLSQGEFERFDPKKGVEVDISEFEVMRKMMLSGKELYDELAESKREREAGRTANLEVDDLVSGSR
eukprot:988799-Karenia_brevis.AAC.1